MEDEKITFECMECKESKPKEDFRIDDKKIVSTCKKCRNK